MIIEGKTKILRVKTLNIQKVNIIEKGAATLSIEYLFLNGVKKYFSNVKFDLVLYTTPPITFTKIIKYIKKRDNSYCYLLLKDIFPQNAVDMKMLKRGGVLHRFFLYKERRLYEISDTIGCLSEANRLFLFRNNKNIDKNKVEVNPNSIEPITLIQSIEKKTAVKLKYKLPLDKKIFIYGGNLGKPQGLDFLLETIDLDSNSNTFFLVVGSGTEYNRVCKWFEKKQPKNALLLSGLPKKEYDDLLRACDVGLIFLHIDFTIPNFPSRLLSYLEMKVPVIAATDSSTDIGSIIEKNNCGYWVKSGDIEGMKLAINRINEDDTKFNEMKENALSLLKREYDVRYSFNLIKNKINNV